MSAADSARYKNDAQFRKATDQFVADNLDGAAQYFAQSALKQIGQTGQTSQAQRR